MFLLSYYIGWPWAVERRVFLESRGAASTQTHGHAAAAPAAGLAVKMTGDFESTTVAAIPIKAPLAQDKPIALDQSLTAAWTPGAAPLAVMDVAGIDVAQTLGASDGARSRQRPRRRVRFIEHLVIGMKGGEMPGHIGPQVGGEPVGSF